MLIVNNTIQVRKLRLGEYMVGWVGKADLVTLYKGERVVCMFNVGLVGWKVIGKVFSEISGVQVEFDLD